MTTFEGFAPEALRFLEQLAENNERGWFDQHRSEYEELLLEPARDFVVVVGERFYEAGVEVHAIPKVGGSLMRINRDTRFSRDKRPYKTHIDLWFWQGTEHSRRSPGYWFRLTPKTLILGAGMHHFEPPQLDRYREAVLDARRGPALLAAVEAVRRAGVDEIGGRRYKRLPRGFEPQGNERDDLLRHDALYAGFEQRAPAEVHTPRFPDFCVAQYLQLRPLQEWLLELFG